MRAYIKILLLLTILPLYLSASNLEKKAFAAYKAKNYVTSIKLYTQAAKNKNLKAYLMLALFYEKGIGLKENKTQAIKFYKYILKSTMRIKKIINRKDYKKINIAIVALNRLGELEKNSKYHQLAKKLSLYKKNIDISQTALFNDNIGGEDDYLILCPNAEIIPPEDREGIEDFDCALFEYFPKEMAKFMKLRRMRFNIMKMPIEKGVELFKKIENKIAKVRKPMIKYLQQEVVDCYNRAVDSNSVRSCDYDYLLKTDSLLFKSRAYNMEQFVLHNNLENHNITKSERAILVDKLIKNINNKTYLKVYNNMVK